MGITVQGITAIFMACITNSITNAVNYFIIIKPCFPQLSWAYLALENFTNLIKLSLNLIALRLHF